MVEFDNNSSAMTVSNSVSGDASVSSGQVAAPLPVPVKKKRNLPGMPDPEAEVIALSPKTLMATNRFVCEICTKGFQRDQNLQLHRRGHNLPWKLRQRTGKEPRKRVYVCPEPSCIHHDPSRALGDLTGIKKHFSRKHGEKKWKCEKCSKKYAVQSDWKAHSKTCGTREYRCDCGTLFSRRDSFITHRAFCDALAEENAKAGTGTANAVASSVTEEDGAIVAVVAAAEAPPLCVVAPPEQQEPEKIPVGMQYLPPASIAVGGGNNGSTNSSSSSSTASIFANLFASAPAAHGASFSDMIGNISRSERPVAADVPALCLAGPGSLFSQRQQFAPAPVPAQAPPTPHMSATALLQKAAQMGATASNGSFLRGFGLASSSSGHQESRQENGMQWHQQPPHHQQDPEPPMLSAALGLGLSYQHEMMGSSSLFGQKPSATLDFLGLGMRPGGSGTGGLSALITSMGSDLDEVDVAAPTGQFRGASSSTGRGWESERKPAIL